MLVGFLALSALTLATFAWHPLQRLERTAGRAPAPAPAKAESAEAGVARRKATETPSRRRGRRGAKARDEAQPAPKADGKPAKAEGRQEARAASGAPGDKDLGPVWEVELLEGAADARGSTPARASSTRCRSGWRRRWREFKVEGDVAGRTTGPVVTQYGVRLRPGVKMNRLVNLADDLALKMSAPLDPGRPYPRRDMVGVEVPNPKSRVVVLRELLEDDQWSGEERLLPVALGLDLEGGRSSPTWRRCRTC